MVQGDTKKYKSALECFSSSQQATFLSQTAWYSTSKGEQIINWCWRL